MKRSVSRAAAHHPPSPTTDTSNLVRYLNKPATPVLLTVQQGIARRTLSTFDGLPPSSRNGFRLAIWSVPLSKLVLSNFPLQSKRVLFKTGSSWRLHSLPSATNLENRFQVFNQQIFGARREYMVLVASSCAKRSLETQPYAKTPPRHTRQASLIKTSP